MKQTTVQSPSINEQNPLSHQQQQQVNNQVASHANSGPAPAANPPNPNTRRLTPNLPCRDLLTGPRKKYLEIGVPLYEASIRCDWVAAKAILDENKDLVRYSITENGETALHVAASAKGDSKRVEEFVKNLVGLMEKEDLTIENENFNTALYLAAVAGNIETIKIMVKENRSLLTIPGAGGQMMPLYAAALFGNYDVVKYLFEHSKELRDDRWTDQNRGWLLEKCVDNDMFVFSFIDSIVREGEKENKALSLLRIIGEDIASKPKIEIDRILRGPPDSIKQDKTTSGRVVQAIQQQKLISEHLNNLEADAKNIIKEQPLLKTPTYLLQKLIMLYN